jgi:hypothetical protein
MTPNIVWVLHIILFITSSQTQIKTTVRISHALLCSVQAWCWVVAMVTETSKSKQTLVPKGQSVVTAQSLGYIAFEFTYIYFYLQ